MFFVFGSRLMGKVDEVPGLFHVATKFGHINFLPLIPMQSYVVLGKNGRSFRGVPIPMSGKSVLAAWGRSIGVLAALIGGIFALVEFTSPRGPGRTPSSCSASRCSAGPGPRSPGSTAASPAPASIAPATSPA